MTVSETIEAVWVDGGFQVGGGPPLDLYDPSTGKINSTLLTASDVDVDRVVEASHEAFLGDWAEWAPSRRGELCREVARSIRDRESELVDLVVADGGLPVWMARADVHTSARYFEYYGGLADKLSGRTVPLGRTAIDYTVHEPWGVCAVVLPFNVPLQMAARSVAAAIISGNTVVLKPADQAPLVQLLMAAIVAAAGAPANVVTAVAGTGATTGNRVINHHLVDHITFTGSLPTGKRIMAAAAESMKPVLLELGGKSPQLVFSDADLDLAVPAIVGSALRSAGQVCSAGSRVLVDRSRHDELLARLVASADALRVGSAADNLDLGPVVSADQRDKIASGVQLAVVQGAAQATRRPIVSSVEGGYFVNPCVLSTDDPQNHAAREEIFGPVLTVLPADSEEHAIAMSQDSEYGLVAGVWTNDVRRAHRTARQLRAGQVYVNCYGVGGGVELPFGGYRRSGFGRLKGIDGALAYTQTKNVCVDL
jgi:aldehyde dehydrogenase (NAD+)